MQTTLRAIQRRATTDATAAVSLCDLRVDHDERALLDSASFDVRRCEIVLIPGGSGSRNSSLMPAELRHTQPRRGRDKDAFCQLKFTLPMSMETISISRMGRRSGPRV
jgi:ABC-type ATPase involved in cell division